MDTWILGKIKTFKKLKKEKYINKYINKYLRQNFFQTMFLSSLNWFRCAHLISFILKLTIQMSVLMRKTIGNSSLSIDSI